MNAITRTIIDKRNGFYLHALEVCDVYEFQSIIDEIYSEFINDYSIDVIIEFIQSMELYCLIDENADEVFNFKISDYINQL
jgi:hypothetical protein